MFKTNKISYFNVYTIAEVGCIINRSERTVRDFIKDGLKTIDDKRPFLIRGYDLIEFLKAKNVQNRHQTSFDEMFCIKCREVRHPKARQIQIHNSNNRQFISVSAVCSVCGCTMNKEYKLEQLGDLKRNFNIVEKLSISDSGNCPVNCRLSDSINRQKNGSYKKEQLCMQFS